MGTRAKITILDEQHKDIICLYSQYDGYPSGVGQQIVDFLKDKKLVNGISVSEPSSPQLNGMGDLAVRLIVYLKQDSHSPGCYYLYNPLNCRDQYCNYVIYVKQILELPPDYNTFSHNVDDYYKVALKYSSNDHVLFNDVVSKYDAAEIERLENEIS